MGLEIKHGKLLLVRYSHDRKHNMIKYSHCTQEIHWLLNVNHLNCTEIILPSINSTQAFLTKDKEGCVFVFVFFAVIGFGFGCWLFMCVFLLRQGYAIHLIRSVFLFPYHEPISSIWTWRHLLTLHQCYLPWGLFTPSSRAGNAGAEQITKRQIM